MHTIKWKSKKNSKYNCCNWSGLLIISDISGFANLDIATTLLAGAQELSANIKQFESKIIKYRIKAFSSIIVAILLWYYVEKIVEKGIEDL